MIKLTHIMNIQIVYKLSSYFITGILVINLLITYKTAIINLFLTVDFCSVPNYDKSLIRLYYFSEMLI